MRESAPNTGNAGITVDLSRVAHCLGATAAFLVIAHLIAQAVATAVGVPGDHRAAHVFHLDREGNAPTLFSSGMFLINAILVLGVRKAERRAGQPDVVWTALAAIFCLLAIDESFSLHERLMLPIRTLFNASGVFYFAWIIPYGCATALLSVCVMPTMLRMHRQPRRLFMLSACAYVSGAIGLEMVGGYYVESMGTYTSLTYQAVMTSEESLELAGLVLCGYALLQVLRHYNVDFTFNVPWSRQRLQLGGLCLQLAARSSVYQVNELPTPQLNISWEGLRHGISPAAADVRSA